MTDDIALKIHYQTLKARCLEIAIASNSLTTEAEMVALAKRLYNEITGENWTGPDVEGA